MSLSWCAALMSSARLFRAGLHVESLEDRRLLSASQYPDPAESLFVKGEATGDTLDHFSHLVGSAFAPSTAGVSLAMVSARKIAEVAPTESSSRAADPLKTEASTVSHLLAVPPDESVDPFVDCAALDEDFCLPTEIDLDFEIDTL